MAYIDVITLAEAKTYLRIDDTLTEDDASITQMIQAALSKIETYTNNYVFSRNKTYNVQDNCIRVYDYPVNTVITSDVEVKHYSGYSIYTLNGETLELNIGHDLPADVPSALKESGLAILKIMYYEQQTNEKVKDSIPEWTKVMLDQYRRFIV